MIHSIRSTSSILATRRSQLRNKISKTKKTDPTESVSSVGKVAEIKAIGLDAIEAIQSYNTKQNFHYEKFQDPPLYALPKDKRESFKDEEIYRNEQLLLEMIINSVNKSKIGIQYSSVINLLKEKDRISFAQSSNLVHNDVFHKVNHGTTTDDVFIIISKDNTIENMAASLIHEATHFMDIKKAIAKNLTFYRFDTEVNAIANSYRFYKEAKLLQSYSFLNLDLKTKEIMSQFYRYAYGDNNLDKEQIIDLLCQLNYMNLNESYSY